MAFHRLWYPGWERTHHSSQQAEETASGWSHMNLGLTLRTDRWAVLRGLMRHQACAPGPGTIYWHLQWGSYFMPLVGRNGCPQWGPWGLVHAPLRGRKGPGLARPLLLTSQQSIPSSQHGLHSLAGFLGCSCIHRQTSGCDLPVHVPVDQWFSTFLMPRPFNTVPHVVVTPNHKIIFVATS